jgi:pimeloyl-ACP methyl ester carboxylesterase
VSGGLPAGFESTTAEVKDLTMHCVHGGAGDPLVIVHGGWDSWWAWRELIPVLAETHTVILPAIRGLAETSKPADGYDANNLGDDLHQLLRGLGHDRFTLVGHDWGAVACYTLAAQFRDAVERLAVFEMVIPGVGMLEQAMVPQPGGAYLWHMGFHSVPDIPEMLIEGHLREYMRWFFTAGAASDDAVPEESLDRYVELYSRPGALAAFLRYYREIWRHSEQVREHMREKLSIPVMAYGGDASVGEGVLACMGQLADDVRGGVIPDCGHWVAEEQPEFVLDRLREFLRGEPAAPAAARSSDAGSA